MIGTEHHDICGNIRPSAFPGLQMTHIVWGFIPAADSATIYALASDRTAKGGGIFVLNHVASPSHIATMTNPFTFAGAESRMLLDGRVEHESCSTDLAIFRGLSARVMDGVAALVSELAGVAAKLSGSTRLDALAPRNWLAAFGATTHKVNI